MRLKDKVAVVTGASDEFARAIAIAYAGEGAVLYLHEFEDRRAGLEEITAAVEATGQKVVTGVHDVTHPEPTAAMTREIMDAFGHIDILVNATAGGWHGMFFEATEEDWDRAIDRGLKAYFLTCQHIGKEMARRGKGKIINVTSIVGRIGSGGAIPWGAARGGVDSMTAAIAQDLGQFGVNVTALARGASEHTAYSEEAKKTRLMRLPFGRLGRAADVIGPAIFLASDESEWVTGSVLYADGGYVTGAATDAEHRHKESPYRGP
jgi:NAD(P)-dependent dehydrogenase (short-subunit alcohol dehydrogenase family)